MARVKETETESGGSAVAEAPVEVQASADAQPKPAERYEPALPLEQITPSKSNPRKTFDPAYITDLGNKLKTQLQLQPILVRPHPEKYTAKNPHYEIVVGECRYRAAKEAGLPALMATVRDMKDVDVLRAQLSENRDRQDITALEEAAAYQDLMKKAKWTAEQLAADQKISVRQVYARLALLKLPKLVADALAKGRITAEHAGVIAGLKTPELQEQALEGASLEHFDQPTNNNGAIGDNAPQAIVPIRDFKLYVKRDLLRDLNSAPWDKNELVKGEGCCQGCPFRSSCNPDLFAEADDDVCHNAECFNAKMAGHLKRRQQELKRDGTEAVLVSREWNPDVKGAVSKNKWEESKAKNAVVGIITDGPDRGKEIRVKIEKPSASNTSSGPTKEEQEAEREKRRKEEEKRKFDQDLANRVFGEIAKNTPAEFSIEIWRSLAAHCGLHTHGLPKDVAETIAKVTGLKPGYHNEKEFKTLSEKQCRAVLFLGLLEEYTGTYVYDRKPLYDAAKTCGVDLDAVRAKLKADMAGVPVEKPKDDEKISALQIKKNIAAKKMSKPAKTKPKTKAKKKK